MSAQGSAPRATLDLKVRVWGMGANNQPFFQNAMAQNISATGACIYGIEPELKVGDVIGVQYEGKKARCRVIWVVDAGALKKTQVGVQLVADQDCPWALVLPADMKVDERTQQRHDNRRKFMRHKISYPLELRDERVNTPLRVNATDISGNGCYVETVMPLAVGTALRVDLWIEDERTLATPPWFALATRCWHGHRVYGLAGRIQRSDSRLISISSTPACRSAPKKANNQPSRIFP